MTETYRFFDLLTYTEAEFAEYINRLTRPEGVFPEIGGGQLNVSAPGGMTVNVADGEASVKGFWYRNSATIGVSIGSNSSGSTRIDTIVLRLDRTGNTLTVQKVVGTPGAGAPTLTQVAGGTWEFPLANVSVANGAVSLATGNLTDRRVFSQWSPSALDPTVAYDADVAAEATARAGVQTNLNTHAGLSTHVRAYARGLTNSGGGASAGVAVNFGFASITRTGTATIDFVFSVAAGSTNYVAIGNSAGGAWVITGIATTGFTLSWGATDGHWEIVVVGG